MHRYVFCGLGVESELALPLCASGGIPGGDIRFSLQTSEREPPTESEWIHHWHFETGEVALSLGRGGDGFLLRFPDLADFSVGGEFDEIVCVADPGTSAVTIRQLLLHQVLPRVLSQRGELMVHASAVTVSDEIIAFLGISGAGKTTIAQSLASEGLPLVADDCLRLAIAPDGEVSGYPSYPGPASGRPLGCEVMGSAPIQRLYFLDVQVDDGDAPRIEGLSRRDGMMALTRSAFVMDFESGEALGRVFETAARVATELEIFGLSYRREYALLPVVKAAVLGHAAIQRGSEL